MFKMMLFKVYKQQLFKVGWVGVKNTGSQHKSLIISATAVILFFFHSENDCSWDKQHLELCNEYLLSPSVAGLSVSS